MRVDDNLVRMPMGEVISRIVSLNSGLAQFWSRSHGWAPPEAASLLTKSRLDWQVSLSSSLRNWISAEDKRISDGDLILAWANIGALVEGTLKILLCVYYRNFLKDVASRKKPKFFDAKRQVARSPDVLTLELLRQFCNNRSLLTESQKSFVELVQCRRNAIHAFADRPIGNDVELDIAVRDYLRLLRSVNSRLPYPDDCYVPREF